MKGQTTAWDKIFKTYVTYKAVLSSRGSLYTSIKKDDSIEKWTKVFYRTFGKREPYV